MKTPRIPPELGLLTGMGFSVAVWLTLGILTGRWADGAWGIGPWGTLGGSLAGIMGAAMNVYQIVKRLDRLDNQKHDETPRT
jgi:F0F1-type ATP synthase assembly protein I